MEDTLVGILFFLILGIFILVYHLRLLYGRGKKSTYMADHIYLGRVYAAIPAGIASLFFAAAGVSDNPTISLSLIYIGIGFIVIALIFAFTQPSFLKPDWLRWLEREYVELMPVLRSEVHKMGENEWNERIQTQADLEEWVEEVRQKYEK